MVDIHCHILPGIDDGSDTWETTTRMCRMAVRDGITHIVATPHCDGHYEYDRAHFTDMLATLSEVAAGQLTFSIGCDFHLSPRNVDAAMEDPRPFAIGDTQYIMVEFDHHSIPANAAELLLALISRGMVPIITHPERNSYLMKDLKAVAEFVEMGCLTQITANALTGFWGPKSQAAAERLLQKNLVHVIATDAHDVNLRPPVLSEARERVTELASASMAEALVMRNPAAVVAGHSLAASPVRR
jgi:protein-tyrosine phosphatase